MWILTPVSVVCNWILSRSFDYVQERLIPVSDPVNVCFGSNGRMHTVRLRLGADGSLLCGFSLQFRSLATGSCQVRLIMYKSGSFQCRIR
jgi:hypothetical protein